MSDARDPAVDTDPVWRADVGYIPYKVTAIELVMRKRVVYLQWRSASNWRYESLGFRLYDAQGRRLKGRALKALTDDATARAKAKHKELITGMAGATLEPVAPCTIGQAWAKVSDKHAGLYPVDTHHRRHIDRALRHAARVWGRDRAWGTIAPVDITKLARTRVDELRADNHTGYRGAEETVSRVLTVAQWLRDQEHIPRDAALPSSRWKEDLRAYWAQVSGTHGDPEPHRPRYTLAEMLQILAAAPLVDPRLALGLALGAELRLGQVARTMRSQLNLHHSTHGAFVVKSNRRKRGTTVFLTPGQRAALDEALGGYLRLFEAEFQETGRDYPLLPAGRLLYRRYKGQATAQPPAVGELATSVNPRSLREWFDAAESRAGITHIPGRGWYGMRRRGVDEFKKQGGSKDALKEHGGWTDTTIPDMIYADQEAEAPRAEARDIRARIRGETPPAPPSVTPSSTDA